MTILHILYILIIYIIFYYLLYYHSFNINPIENIWSSLKIFVYIWSVSTLFKKKDFGYLIKSFKNKKYNKTMYIKHIVKSNKKKRNTNYQHVYVL